MMKTLSLLFLMLASGLILADPPGANCSPELRQQLKASLQSQAANYQPGTRHQDENGRPLYINWLMSRDSTHLLQHTHNPVDWYPSGEEAYA